MWLLLALACRTDPRPASVVFPPGDAPPIPTGDTGHEEPPDASGAWFVETGWPDSGTAPTTPTDDSALPFDSATMAAGAAFFLDSGIPDCEAEPQLDTGALPSTRDEELAALPFDPDADRDGDGFVGAVDCDDADPRVFPGAPERCDGVDTDCDPVTAEAGLVTLDADQTFVTVADATFAAAPGSTVVLCPGTHEGPLWLRGDLRLAGLPGQVATTVFRPAAGNPRNLLRVQRGDLRIHDLTLTGANVDGATVGFWNPEPFWPPGGALSVGECGSVVGRRLIVNGNTTYGHGAGVGSAGAPVALFDTVLSTNTALGSGGGVYGAGAVTLTRVVVEDNQASTGGGAFQSGGGFTGVDLDVRRNLATRGGGGAWLVGAEVELTRGTWSENTTPSSGAGGLQLADGDASFVDLVFADNVGTSGGGMACIDGQVEARNLSVTGNVATANGGGLYARDCTSTLLGLTITGNEGRLGGGLYAEGGATSLVDALVTDNAADECGGICALGATSLERVDVVGNVADLRGGGVTISRDAVVDATDTVIRGNSAPTGGGLAISSGTLVGGRIEANEATTGGGVAAVIDGPSWLVGTRVEANVADWGGGLFVEQATHTEGVTFSANAAPYGPTTYVADAAVAGWWIVDSVLPTDVQVALGASGTWLALPAGDHVCSPLACDPLPLVHQGFTETLLDLPHDQLAVHGDHVVGSDGGTLHARVFGPGGLDEVAITAVRADVVTSLAIHGDLLVVGNATAVDAQGIDGGTVDVFRWSGAGWTWEGELPTLAEDGADFGAAVATDGTWIAVGAPDATVNGVNLAGATALYRHDGASWVQDAVLHLATPVASQHMGRIVGVGGDRVALFTDRTYGLAEVYRHDGATWVQEVAVVGRQWDDLTGLVFDGSLLATRAGNGQPVNLYDTTGLVRTLAPVARMDDASLVTSLALDDTLMVVGLPFDDDMGRDVGAVLVVRLPESEPVHIADLARTEGLELGTRVWVAGQRVWAEDDDGQLHLYEPTATDPAW